MVHDVSGVHMFRVSLLSVTKQQEARKDQVKYLPFEFVSIPFEVIGKMSPIIVSRTST